MALLFAASRSQQARRSNSAHNRQPWRWTMLVIIGTVAVVIVLLRLWQLQVVNHDFYLALASGQRELYQQLFPKRGAIYATEKGADGSIRLIPLAINRRAYIVYANTREVSDPAKTAAALAGILDMPADALTAILSKPKDPYVPIKRRVSEEAVARIKDLNMAGLGLQEMAERFYPNNESGSHVLGFVSYKDNSLVGQYGIEGSFNKVLAGTAGAILSERDAKGVWIPMADRQFIPAEDGADLVLTIDWPIQFYACRALDEWVSQHGADGGSVVVINPQSGAILAMCGNPDFNPNTYNEAEKIAVFNNPATFLEYEPGSIMKTMTMSAAIDQQKVKPETTYNDTGEVKIGSHTIRNSDSKAYGVQTMVSVLEKSLNTGAIFAMRQLGAATFKKYIDDFGFGELTGIELDGEAMGDVSRLSEKNEIYAATSSFGQGITVTPLQMVAAYATMANGGKLMKPYLVQKITHANGQSEIHEPVAVRQVVSERTAAVVGGMLVSVVEEGHGKRAGVPGYHLAGKTGTAEIPRKDGPGYEPGAAIGSFVGYGPVENPRFAMIVRIDRPRDVQFAESSAAPLFGKIAKFILQYYEIPPRQSSAAP